MSNKISSSDFMRRSASSSSSLAASSSDGLSGTDEKILQVTEQLKILVKDGPGGIATFATESDYCEGKKLYEFTAFLTLDAELLDNAVTEFLRAPTPEEQAKLRDILDVYRKVHATLGKNYSTETRELISENLYTLSRAVSSLPDKTETEEVARIESALVNIAENEDDPIYPSKRTHPWLIFSKKVPSSLRYQEMIALFSLGGRLTKAFLILIKECTKNLLEKLRRVINKFETVYRENEKNPSKVIIDNINMAKFLIETHCDERLLETLYSYLESGDESQIVDKVRLVREQIRSNLRIENKTKSTIDGVLGRKSWLQFDQFATKAILKTENFLIAPRGQQTEPHTVDFNNYGIIPLDVHKSGGNVQSFDYLDQNGVKQTFIVDKFPVFFANGMIVSTINSGVNHDVVEKYTFNNQDGVIMTLCDGCGHSDGAKKAALLATESISRYLKGDAVGLWSGINEQSYTAHQALKMQFDALKYAQNTLSSQKEDEYGETTLAQVFVKGDVLTGLFVGDVKGMVLRPKPDGTWKCIDLTKSVKWEHNAADPGGKLVGNKSDKAPPELDRTQAVSFRLQKGDVVMISSDGVSDCFDPEELKDGSNSLESNIESALKGIAPDADNLPEKLEAKFKDVLQTRTVEEKVLMFSTGKKQDHRPGWGKQDNANMAFYVHK